MPGAESLGGLIYQQRYVHFRVLSQVALKAAGATSDAPHVVKFSVEGWNGDQGPVWDIIFEFSNGTLELHECKDTAISKEDRLIFYDRLRRQIASGTPAEEIRPVWVTDPDKQTPNALKYLEGIADTIGTLDLTQLAAESPLRMNSTADAIREAVHRLCHYTPEEEASTSDGDSDPKAQKKPPQRDWPRPCSFAEAKAVLKNVRIVRQRFVELDQSIQLLSAGVFTSGTPDSVQKFVTGVLTERVVNEGKADFTVDEFLQAVGTTALEQGLSGLLRDLMTFSAGSRLRPNVRRIIWRNLGGAPVTAWTLAERVPDYQPGRSGCLLADMGIGKTVASQLSFALQATQSHPSRTLRLEVRNLDEPRLDALLRLVCMLCGVGSTWLAIDGLDEAPQRMREQWIRVLGALLALPNLTLLVTVRREVFTVQEWLAEAVAALPRLPLQPLSTQQVQQSFAAVGLPVPSNGRLVEVLRNPFLLSLYADIITPAEMPLAESGEVTAFRVIDEFWQRRVRGISVGQRAVGDSELSQEPKRKAAVFLGEQSLAGEMVIVRSGLDAEVEKGIEMLLREGVLREQGAAAVTWAHEWLREYAIIETLVTRLETVSAASLAKTIYDSCDTDHVARAAAAAGLKWIAANPAVGSSRDYLTELAKHQAGLAREALIVLLEGSPIPGILAQLSDELLAEALTLAVSLRVPHWSEQVAALDEARFFGAVGDRLHAIGVDYELKIAPGAGHTSADTVRRLTARDLKRWEAERPSYLRTVVPLLEEIIATAAYGDAQVDDWLVRLGGVSNQYSFGQIRDAITGLITAGAYDLAHDIYRATMGFADAERGEIIADALVARRFAYERDLINILHTLGLLQRVDTWGRTGIELLAQLVEAKQRSNWPSTRRLAKALGVQLNEDTAFVPNHDQEPRVTTLDDHDDDHPIVRTRLAIEQTLSELAAANDGSAFQLLADQTIATQFAAVIAIPLLVLYDAVNKPGAARAWHEAEILRLLANPRVLELASLHDVRRLLRRQLPTTLAVEAKGQLADALRQAALPDDVRIRELSDLRDWQVLTPEELQRMARAAEAEDLWEPTDPRTEPLFHVGPIPAPPRRDSNWPYAEDAEHIRVLQNLVTSSKTTEASHPEEPEFASQIQALNAVLGRPEAKTVRWSGTLLGWCSELVKSLRHHAESLNQPGDRLNPQTWEGLLNTHAPWWRDMAALALNTLSGPVPEHHVGKTLDRTMSWSFGDPILSAADFLDAVLTIEPVPPFAELQSRLVTTITHQWSSWPPFSKATVLSSLRTWFVEAFPALRALLGQIVQSEADPVVVRYAVMPLLQLAQTQQSPELGVLLERAKSGGHEESLGQVAEFLGAAYVLQTTQPEYGGGQATSTLLDSALRSPWPDRQAQMQFLDGVLSGARQALPQLRTEEKEQGYEAWLHLVELVIVIWPFDDENQGDQERFPLRVICAVVEAEASVEQRTNLFLRLAPIFEAILRRGELAAYCQLHFDLKRFIVGGHSPIRGSQERQAGVIAGEATDKAFAELCRASMERVVTWHHKGTKTDDFGWASGLRGEDSVELIERCIDASQNREYLKRHLLPLVDLLANAGQPERAADLRIYLRNA
jgi:hypothetical protein